VLATGDDFGKVNLFKYPCVQEKSASKSFIGHSSHVTEVKFSASDKYVISTGGNDKTVIVWETDFALENFKPNQVEEDDEEYEDYGEDDGFSGVQVD